MPVNPETLFSASVEPRKSGIRVHPASEPGSERVGDWMQTYSGHQFWPLDPRPEEIHVIDIAHSLANQCRYAGHCREFFSVAQHSVIVSRIVPPEFALWGLLHDAAEAYLVDLPRPVKRFSAMGSVYREIEQRVMSAVCVRFGLDPSEPLCVKDADDVALMTEKRDLMPGNFKWRETAQPLAEIIRPLTPSQAEGEFLTRAGELGIAWIFKANPSIPDHTTSCQAAEFAQGLTEEPR